MKPRRAVAVLALLGAAGWMACSSYGENDTPAASDGGADVVDASTTPDSGPDGIAIVDADLDALVTGDAGSKVDAAACNQNIDCDCDKDGFPRAGCSDAAAPDCDDTDQRVRPNQSFLEIPTEPPRDGDWNCNGAVEKLYQSNVTCSGLALGACNGVQGFRQNPACGVAGPYVFCQASGLTCVEQVVQQRTQACK